MRSTKHSIHLALCLALGSALSSGCVVAAGAGVGYLISQEVLPNEVHSAQVKDDAEHVFEVAKETLGFMIEPNTEIIAASAPRVAKGTVDGATVKVTVEAYDLDRTIVNVEADRPLRRDGVTAAEVLNAILDRLDK